VVLPRSPTSLSAKRPMSRLPSRPSDDIREPRDLEETRRELVGMADRKTGDVPATLLVEHVLRATTDGDWPVRRAALEALVRRVGFCEKDELRVAQRPAAGSPFGAYATRRKRRPERPYDTRLWSVAPLRASCDCNDFLRNSLGYCKHVHAALTDIARRPRKWRRALASEGDAPCVPPVIWDPVRPLTGAGDWLERVSWDRSRAGRAPPPTLRGDFVRDGENTWRLRPAAPSGPQRRARQVERLARCIDEGAARRNGRAVETVQHRDPALRTLLSRECERLTACTGSASSDAALRRRLGSLRKPLYPYQLAGVQRFLEAGALLLGDDMGLGKTAQAVAACHLLLREGRVKRGLLIVPASLKSQWLREWKLFSDAPIEIVEGRPDERAAIYARTDSGFLITNYAQLLRDLPLIHAWDAEIVVLDEAQRIKNWATKTAAYVKQLRPRYRLVLTGTPMENRLEELTSLMDWVDDLALEPKWRLPAWHVKFADGTGTSGRGTISGARNLDTLRERLAPAFLRRVRHEVLRELPERTDTVIPIAMTAAQKSEHDDLTPPIARLLSQGRKRPLRPEQFLRLMSLFTTQRIIANGLGQLDFAEAWPAVASRSAADDALRATLSSPKLDEFREIVRRIAIDQGRRIVVFSQWRRMLKLAHWAVTDVLAEHGLRGVFFTGHESQSRRTHNVVDFHDDPDTRILFASDAGGVGLNLQRAASCVVNLELPWNPAVLEQRIGRIYRIGQKDPIDVFKLVSTGSIEERIAGLVSDKRALFEGLFDGTTNELQFERSGSFLARLERIIEPVDVPDLPDTTDDGASDETIAEDARIDEIAAAAAEDDDDLLPAAPSTTRPDDTPASVAADCGVVPHAGTAAATAAIQGLFADISVTTTAAGGLHIEAPPAAAATLASVFEGLASVLRRTAGASVSEPATPR